MNAAREILRFLWATLRRFLSDGCLHRSAAIAYYALLSSGPALIVGVWIMTFFTGSSPEAFAVLIRILGDLFPSGQEESLEQLVRGFEVPQSLVLAMIPILVWTALLVFLEVEQAVSAIFRTGAQRLLVFATLKSFALFGLFGVILVGTFLTHNVLVAVASAGMPPVGRLLPVAGTVLIPLGSTVVIFAFIYWVLPHTSVRLKHALVGGATAAAFWEAAKHIYGAVVARAPTYGLFYGPLSLVVITLIWAYLSAAILLLGAEAVALRGEGRSGRRAAP